MGWLLYFIVLNLILLPLKFIYCAENLHCCNGRRHDVNCTRPKCYVTCVRITSYVKLICVALRLFLAKCIHNKDCQFFLFHHSVLI